MRRLLPTVAFVCALSLIGGADLRCQGRRTAETPGRQATQERPAVADVDAKLRQAASEHAIIAIHLDEGKYEAVPEEFRKILDLNLTGDNEKLVAQAAWQIVEKLREARRYNLAHEIVNDTLSQVVDVQNRFSLLMLRGKIFQDQKLYQQAIEAVREAQELRPE